MSQNERRKNVFIDRQFQTSFILKFCIVAILSSIIIGLLVLIFTSNSTTVAIEGTKVFVKSTSDFLLPAMIFTIATVTLFSASAVIMLAMLTSHKIAGPLFSINRTARKLKEGDLTESFHIRSDDQLGSLSQSLNEFIDVYKEKIGQMKATVQQLEECSVDPKKNAPEIQSLSNKLNGIISSYKT
jgi:methyl-accepting chemotaxis protein